MAKRIKAVTAEVMEAIEAAVPMIEEALPEKEARPQVDVIDTAAPEEVLVETAESVTVVVKSRNFKKRIHLKVGPVALADLEYPVGFDPAWNEDKVATTRVQPNSHLVIDVPEECNMTKWVKYYKSLAALGILVLKFGSEEEVK